MNDLSTPPIVRIQDFNKIQYEKKRKMKEQRRKNKQHELKEIQFKPHIADGDLKIKVNRIEEFLTKGHKVKVAVRLKGRERYIAGLGAQVLDRVLSQITIEHKVSKQGGPISIVILEPV